MTGGPTSETEADRSYPPWRLQVAHSGGCRTTSPGVGELADCRSGTVGLCRAAAGLWLVMYRLATNLAVGVRKRSMAIPAVGKQHTDDAIDKACSDVGDVVHSPVQARESDQQRGDEAEKHCDPPQPHACDMECQEGEGEIERGRRADVSAWIAAGRRRHV